MQLEVLKLKSVCVWGGCLDGLLAFISTKCLHPSSPFSPSLLSSSSVWLLKISLSFYSALPHLISASLPLPIFFPLWLPTLLTRAICLFLSVPSPISLSLIHLINLWRGKQNVNCFIFTFVHIFVDAPLPFSSVLTAQHSSVHLSHQQIERNRTKTWNLIKKKKQLVHILNIAY